MTSPQGTSSRHLVWYASYGSNLNYRDRFMCYISGGKPPGSSTTNPGCRDKKPPLDSRPIELNFELYFAHYFKGWRGAAAFIRGPGNAQDVTLGRMYLITDDQFNDVVLQENGKQVDGTRFVPSFDDLLNQQSSILSSQLYYGRLLRIRVEERAPVLTFTTSKDLLIGPPSEAYIKVIVSGIRETYPAMSDSEICNYLLRADGVRGNLQPETIASWVAGKATE